MNSSNWIMDVGKMSKGYAVFWIPLYRLPDLPVECCTFQFYKHASQVKEKIEIFIDVYTIPDLAIDVLKSVLKSIPKELHKRVKHITLINPSFKSTEILNNKVLPLLPDGYTNIIRITDDISTVLSKKDKVFLPLSVFGHKSEERGSINVIFNEKQALLSIGENSFILSSDATIFNIETRCNLAIPFNAITSISEQKVNMNSGVSIKYAVENNQEREIKLITSHYKYIRYAYDFIKDRFKYQITTTPSQILSSVSPCFRHQMIAFSLFLIAQNQSYLIDLALQLFEASIHNFSAAANCAVYAVDKCRVNMGVLFKEVENSGVLEPVVEILSTYLGKEDSSIVLNNLLPIFLVFMNTCTNISLMSKVMKNIIKTANKPTIVTLLEEYFFSEFTSKLAVEVCFSVILMSNLSSSTAQKCIQSFTRKHGSTVGNFVTKVLLDGLIRRRSFGNLINTANIFSSIPTLTYNCPEFASADLPLFFFCTIMGGVYTTDETIHYIRQIYEGLFSSLIDSRPDIKRDLLIYKKKILNILDYPKVLNPLELILVVDTMMKSLGQDYQDRFRNLLTQSNLDDNPRIWYIKSAAEIHFSGGSEAMCKKLISLLPDLQKSNDFAAQKIALVFDSLSKSIDKIKVESKIPLYLIWTSILSSNHNNSMLRASTLKLLQSSIEYTSKNGGYDFIVYSFSTMHSISDNIYKSIQSFQKEMNINFITNFSRSFASSFLHTVEDIYTREEAINVLKVCITYQLNKPDALPFYVLPIVLFGSNESIQWLYDNLQISSFEQLIFSNFDRHNISDSMWMISLINTYFGSRTCQHRIEETADLLIYGPTNYPLYFDPIRSSILEKCWEMIEKESSISKLDKLTRVMNSFLIMTDSGITTEYQEELQKIQFKKIESDSIDGMLSQCIKGVYELLPSN